MGLRIDKTLADFWEHGWTMLHSGAFRAFEQFSIRLHKTCAEETIFNARKLSGGSGSVYRSLLGRLQRSPDPLAGEQGRIPPHFPRNPSILAFKASTVGPLGFVPPPPPLFGLLAESWIRHWDYSFIQSGPVLSDLQFQRSRRDLPTALPCSVWSMNTAEQRGDRQDFKYVSAVARVKVTVS